MRRRFPGFRPVLLAAGAAAAAALMLGPLPQAANAQSIENVRPAEPPAKLPRPQKGDRTKNLDFLFEALKAAPDAETGKAIEQRIWALWFVSGSDTADLLMTRVRQAMEANDADLALRLLDAIIELNPDYAEAWNRRATLYFTKKD